eukprot:TRINITY_DN1010_c0_g1_i10.p1 TRINITY_DN1010_c0_g1~~TRINITY_DN1010_c0_g1_i10.p1  ORF type:complete len:217 (+),score=69.32 TRINITY_DN1010_c0_g1_i10:466-1116(+)
MKTFGANLHTLSPNFYNPYQQVIYILGRTLEVFDSDHLIPTFGFGDQQSQHHSVFSFIPDNSPCYTFYGVLTRYMELTPFVQLSGPTSFAPIVRTAIDIVKQTRRHHILVVIADGQVSWDSGFAQCETETRKAIVDASNYPLSIIVVGVGDGPWDLMEEFDDELPQRKFDNFQFVEFNKIMLGNTTPEQKEVQFTISALQELPDQYFACKKLGYIG